MQLYRGRYRVETWTSWNFIVISSHVWACQYPEQLHRLDRHKLLRLWAQSHQDHHRWLWLKWDLKPDLSLFTIHPLLLHKRNWFSNDDIRDSCKRISRERDCAKSCNPNTALVAWSEYLSWKRNLMLKSRKPTSDD